MKTAQSALLAGLVALILSACAPTLAQTATPEPAAAPEVSAPPVAMPVPALPAMTAQGSISFWVGGCFYSASCDTWEVRVRPDGSYTLSGAAGEPTRDGQIGPQAFADAEAFLAANGFAAMPERMGGGNRQEWAADPGPCIPHAPGVIITRRAGDGTERRVSWDQGCSSQVMAAFTRGLREAMRTDEIRAQP